MSALNTKSEHLTSASGHIYGSE